MPLVIAFHGAHSTPQAIEAETHLDRIADTHGFLVAYPAGYEGTWNEGAGHTPAEQAGINDVAFVSVLLEHIETHYRVDTTRVAATGFSNGALLTELLGCRLARQLTVIMPVEGPLPTPVAPTCAPRAPVSVLSIQGTADPDTPYTGGQGLGVGGGTQVLSASASVAQWARLDGCDPNPTNSTARQTPSVEFRSYSGCTGGAAVELVSIRGGGHTWPAGRPFDAGQLLWNFLATHSRP
jgi:polyhydroxybutyrate depolymerase